MLRAMGDVDAGYEGTEDHQVLLEAMATLPERERRIIMMRFIDGMTQSEIAAEVGVSQMHVSRLLTASLAKLRESFATEN